MKFTLHPRFDDEITKFLERYHTDKVWISYLKNLLESHFEKKTTILREQVLAPLPQYKNYELWKIYMAVGGVKKSQRPRVAFAKKASGITFLCYGVHSRNYKTSELIKLAKKRLEEIIPYLNDKA